MSNEKTRHLKEMMSDEKKKATVLAVTSGKGGVGKTNIASNLSICFAAAGKKVVLFDADLGLGNVDVIMNTDSKYNLMHVLAGNRTLDEIVNIGPAGVETICGGSGIEELANLSKFEIQRVIDDMEAMQNNSDMIVLDTGAGISSTVISFCQSADQVLVVTTPEPSAMTDAYAMIKVLASRKYSGRINVVVNMASSLAEGKRIYRQLSDVAIRFLDMPLYEAGILCRSEQVLNSVRKRQPVVLNYPKSKTTSAIASMAGRLSRTAVVSGQNESFFRRVVNVFSKQGIIYNR